MVADSAEGLRRRGPGVSALPGRVYVPSRSLDCSIQCGLSGSKKSPVARVILRVALAYSELMHVGLTSGRQWLRGRSATSARWSRESCTAERRLC